MTSILVTLWEASVSRMKPLLKAAYLNKPNFENRDAVGSDSGMMLFFPGSLTA